MHERGTGEGVLTVGEITSRLWGLGILTFAFTLSGYLEGGIALQFMYTRVRCCEGGSGLPAKYDIQDPKLVKALEDEAAALNLALHVDPAGQVGACGVPSFPKSSPLWSLSESCVNRAYVQESTQKLLSLIVPLQKTIIFLILPIGAAASDGLGRRPILGLYAIGSVIGCFLLVMDTQFASGTSRSIFLVVAGFVLLGAGSEPKDAVVVSSIADAFGHDEVNKTKAFACLAACTTVAEFASTGLAYVAARLEITRWEIPWIICTVVAGLVLLHIVTTLRETLPEELRLPLDWGRFEPLASWRQSLRVVWRDRIIVVLCCMDFVGAVARNGVAGVSISYLVIVGYSQDEAMLVATFGAVVSFVSALCMVHLVVKLGVFRSLILSFVFTAAAYIASGPLTLAKPGMAYLGAFLGPVGASMAGPSHLTIVSQRVEKSNQGKLMGSFGIAHVLAIWCSSPIFGLVLFKANATGPRAALPLFVAAGLAVLNFFAALYVAYAAPLIPSAHNIDRDSHPPESTSTRLGGGDGSKPMLGSYGSTDAAAP